MDKKNVLNPKLKEIYERVMSTKVTPTSPVQPPPKPAQSEEKPVATKLTSIAVNAPPSPIKTSIKKQVKNPSQIVLTVAGAMFFLAYAFFWVRFFNVKLPFNLPF